MEKQVTINVVKVKDVIKNYFVLLDTKEIEIKDGIKTVYEGKPKLDIKIEYEWNKELLRFEGELRYNSTLSKQINISEKESVQIEKEIFRADLNELHILVNKVNKEISVNKESAEKELEYHLRLFNKMMIESNETMKRYCDLHKLSYSDTDAIELFKLVYPGEKFEIVNGAIKKKERFHDLEVSYATSAIATTAINANKTCYSSNIITTIY